MFKKPALIIYLMLFVFLSVLGFMFVKSAISGGNEGTVETEELKEYKEEGKNPFGIKQKKENLTDEHYRDYIHGMSHQKVKADRKWGFYEIVPERIEWLLDGLDEADNLQNEKEYREILKKWNDGDFSEAHIDHNVIWKMQNGTVGRATGLLSPEEEEKYMEKK